LAVRIHSIKIYSIVSVTSMWAVG